MNIQSFTLNLEGGVFASVIGCLCCWTFFGTAESSFSFKKAVEFINFQLNAFHRSGYRVELEHLLLNSLARSSRWFLFIGEGISPLLLNWRSL